MTDHPKYDWIDAVAGERKFSSEQGRILIYCAVRYILNSEDTFCVRQETVARRCACGIATVKRTIAQARSLGYLATVERQRGRGHRRGDEHRITFPNPGVNHEIGITADPSSTTEIGITSEPCSTEIGIGADPSSGRNRDHASTEIGITPVSGNQVLPAETPSPIVFSNSSLNGGYLDDGSYVSKGPAFIDNAARPQKQAPSSAALWLVRQVLGNTYPRRTNERLGVRVDSLIRQQGISEAVVRRSLDRWDKLEGCIKPEFLDTVCSDVIKEERAIQQRLPSASEIRFNQTQLLKAHPMLNQMKGLTNGHI